MLNQVVFVGRLVADPTVKELEDGRKVSDITIAIPRTYKDEDGETPTDFIDVALWNAIAENTAEYCHKGDIIGIKGRVQKNKKNLEIIAEKVTFLSSKSK